MKSRKQKIEITIETDQILVIRRSSARAWCQRCAAPVELLTTEETSTATGADLQTIRHLAVNGPIHPVETDDGRLFICLNSLLNMITKGETQ